MRKSAWRSEISEKTERAQNAALQLPMFILIEYGPTCFGVREDGNKANIQVRIGDPHSCTCLDFKKTSPELCKHICWILLKKFRVPKEDPLSWQLGLVESEVDSLLRGYEARTRRQLPPVPVKKSSTDGTTTSAEDGGVPQRKLEPEDICPVCQEDLFTKPRKPVSYCRYSCGNSVHLHCLKLWAEHQQTGDNGIRKLNKDALIACPMCRGKFCTAFALRLELMTVREYLNTKSNTQFADKSSSQANSPASNIDTNSLQPLISVQSVTSLFRNSNVPTPGKGNDIGQSAIIFPPYGHPGILTVNSLVNSHQQTTTLEMAKDVRISLKNPKPGLQCFQCLSWFKKGTIVWQLPCHHLFHKNCLDDKDLTCSICHNQFLLPRPSAASAPAYQVQNTRSHPGPPPPRQVLVKKGDSSSPNLASERHTTDLGIGQIVKQIKLNTLTNKNHSRLAKTSLTSHVVNHVRSATVSGEMEAGYRDEILPSTFCLTATQVTRFAPQSVDIT